MDTALSYIPSNTVINNLC